MTRMLRLLKGEPWCYSEVTIAAMTDYNVAERFDVAEEQAEAFRREHGDRRADRFEDDTPSAPHGKPDRDQTISQLMMLNLALTREEAERDYDKAFGA